MFAQYPRGGGHNLFGVGQWPQGLVQVREEVSLLLRIFTHGNVADCADDLPDTAVFIPGKTFIAAVKPTPLAILAHHPEIELDGFVIAQAAETADVSE